MIPPFLRNACPLVAVMLFPVPSDIVYPMKKEVRKWPEAAKCFFEEEQDSSQVSTPAPLTPTMEGLRLSSLEPQIPKHPIKQGPIKSSKILKFTSADDDE